MSNHGTLIDTDAVQFERLLPAPIDVVWEYLTVPERVATWLAIAEIEPRVGGSARLEWEDWCAHEPPPQGEHWTASGKVTRWDPPKALAYTWLQPGLPESELTFELTARGKETFLVLTHRRLDTTGRHMFAAGWHGHLDLLATRLKGGERGDFIGEFRELLKVYAPRDVQYAS